MSTKLPSVILADFTTSLATAVAVGATTATIQSNVDDDGVTLPDGLGYFTIDGSNSSKEHIQFVKTGANLASIYSVSRQGTLTSGFARAHRLGATVTLTDFATIKYLNDLLKGSTNLDSSDPLEYDGTATISTANQLATKAYVDGVAIAGGADASSTVKGISKLSVDPVSPTNPIAVGDTDTRVPTQDENDALAGTSGTPSSTNKYVTNDDTSTTTSASKVVRANSSGIISNGFMQPDSIWGDGSDGAVTISSNTTLTRDMYYTDLTINSSIVLNTGSYRIFVSGTLTNNGTIRNNGGDASGSTGGTNTKGSLDTGANASNSSGGSAGGAGGNVVWISAKIVAVQGIIEAKGGNASPGQNPGSTYSAINGNSINATLITSGTGGSAGAGGGGSGGSITTSKMSSKNISIMNAFFDFVLGTSLKGGASGATGAGSGIGPVNYGSGGGQGGVIYFRYFTMTTSGPLTVTGGLGGTGFGGGPSGSNGSDGIAIQYQVV